MTDTIKWITSNIGSICTAICSIILVTSIIVKLTPSTKDNEVLGRIINILDKFSLTKTADDKAIIEKAKENLE